MEKLVQADESKQTRLKMSARSFPVFLQDDELTRIRELESLTQEELADFVRVSVSKISIWERHPERMPRAIVKMLGLGFEETFLEVVPLDRFRNQLYSLLLGNVRLQWRVPQALMAEVLELDKKTYSRYERGQANIPDRIREFTMKASEVKARPKPKSHMENNI